MEARKKLQHHIDFLFADAPRSKAAYELQEELLANSIERYQDLTSSGMSEEDALKSVIANIGNVEDLIAALPASEAGGSPSEWNQQQRERSALTVTIAVGLYILAGVVFFVSIFISSYFFEPMLFIGLALAAAICIIPTCMLVYNAHRYPAYKKKEETVVENFKEWNSETQKGKGLRGAISSLVWTLCLVLYFVLSFTTGAWHITWVIFLVSACIEAIITLAFRLKEFRS